MINIICSKKIRKMMRDNAFFNLQVTIHILTFSCTVYFIYYIYFSRELLKFYNLIGISRYFKTCRSCITILLFYLLNLVNF